METATIQIVSFQIVALMAILGFLWRLHRDVSNVRQDMASLRQEVKVDMANLRREVGGDMASLREDFGRETAALRERMARMEGLLEGFVARPAEA